MYRLCKRIKELGYPIEYNFLGRITNRHYPNPDFWKIAAEVGNTAILGLDAHNPDVLKMTDEIENAISDLRGMGFAPLENLTLIKP